MGQCTPQTKTVTRTQTETVYVDRPVPVPVGLAPGESLLQEPGGAWRRLSAEETQTRQKEQERQRSAREAKEAREMQEWRAANARELAAARADLDKARSERRAQSDSYWIDGEVGACVKAENAGKTRQSRILSSAGLAGAASVGLAAAGFGPVAVLVAGSAAAAAGWAGGGLLAKAADPLDTPAACIASAVQKLKEKRLSEGADPRALAEDLGRLPEKYRIGG